MKKLIKSGSILSILIIALLFTSCSKEQQTLNKMAGHWTYSTVKLFGVNVDLATLGYTSATLHFDVCKASTDNCTGVQTLNGTANNFRYNISEDAKSINVYNLSGTTDLYTIISVDKNKLVYTTDIGGVIYEFTLNR
jgi:hypothetical protein